MIPRDRREALATVGRPTTREELHYAVAKLVGDYVTPNGAFNLAYAHEADFALAAAREALQARAGAVYTPEGVPA